MALRDLVVAVGFNGGKAIGGLQEVDKAADKTKLNLVGVAKQFGKLGDGMVKAGKNMTKKVTVPVVGLGIAAVKTVAKFDDTMAKVKGITGATQMEFVQLRKKALQMGRDTKFSASEAGEAFTYMGMAGWNAKQSLAGIDGVMALAAASGEELAGVSDIVTDALSAFQMEAKDAIKFADLLASAATNSNTNVGMLGESFKYVAPLFGALGYSAEDAALGLGLMANAGVKSSGAGTALRAAITNMVNPTDSMATAMETLGFSITDTSGKMKPFKTIMDELRGKFGKLTEEQQAQYAATIFGKEAMTGMLAIINASDEDYAKLTRATREYAGAAKRMAAINEDTVGGSFRSLLSAAESLAIAFGDVIKGPIREFADKIRGITVKFTKLSPATKKIIAGVLGIAAAIGPVLFFGGKLLKGIEFALLAAPKIIAFAKGVKFAFLAVAGGAATLSEGLLFALGPKGLIIAAIIGLITAGIALYKNWDKIKVKFSGILESIKNKFASTFPYIKNILSGMATSIKITSGVILKFLKPLAVSITREILIMVDIAASAFKGVVRILSGFTDIIHGVFALDKERIVKGIKDVFGGAFEGISGIIKARFKPVFDIFDNVKKRIKGFFRGIPDLIKSLPRLLQEGIGKLKEWNERTLEKSKEQIKQWGENVIESLTSVGGRAKELFFNALEGIGSKLSEIGIRAKEWLMSLPGRIGKTFVEIGGKIGEWFKSLPGKLQEAFSNVGEWIRSLPGRVMESLQTAFENIKTSVVGFFSGLGEDPELANTGHKIVTNVAMGITNNKGELLNTLGKIIVDAALTVLAFAGVALLATGVEIVKRVASGVKKAIPKMIDAGKNIVQGLITGIRSMLGKVRQAASDLSDAIGSKIKRFFQIKSPSRLTMGYGKMIGAGLGVGMEKSIPGTLLKAQQAAERVKLSISKPAMDMGETNSYLDNITPSSAQNKHYATKEIFAPQINISIEGDESVKEQMPDIRREVERALYPLLEEYWAQMRIKRPSMT